MKEIEQLCFIHVFNKKKRYVCMLFFLLCAFEWLKLILSSFVLFVTVCNFIFMMYILYSALFLFISVFCCFFNGINF